MNISQVFDVQTLVNINYFRLHMESIHFDCNPPVYDRYVFLDIPKVFDTVWHNELIYKIKYVGINRMLLKLIKKLFGKCIWKNSFKWSNIIIETSTTWWTSGLYFSRFILPNLHKWSVKKSLTKHLAFCWWYILFLHCEKYQCSRRPSK